MGRGGSRKPTLYILNKKPKNKKYKIKITKGRGGTRKLAVEETSGGGGHERRKGEEE